MNTEQTKAQTNTHRRCGSSILKKIWESIGLSMIIIGIFIFNFGQHNVDLSFNILKTSYDYQLPFYSMVDLTLAKTRMPYLDIYMLGSYMELIGLLVCMYGGMIYTAGRVNNR